MSLALQKCPEMEKGEWMEGKEGSDRSDREEQLDVKAEEVFLSLFDFSMSEWLCSCSRPL